MVVPFVILSAITTGGIGYINNNKANNAIGVHTMSYLKEQVVSYAMNIALTSEKNKPENLSYKEFLLETEEGSSYLSNYMKKMSFWGDNDEFLLIESDGDILAVNGDIIVDKNINFIDELANQDSTTFSRDVIVKTLESYDNANLRNTNIETLADYFFFSKIPDTDMILIFHPEDIVIGELRTMFTTIFIGSVLSVFIVAIFSIWKATTIANPLKKIQRLTGHLYKGDLTKSVNISNKDEFGVTSKRLNKAIISLRNTVLDIKETENKTREMIDLTNDKVLSINEKTQGVSADTEHITSQVQESTSSLEEIKNELFKVKLRGDTIMKSSIENASLSENILNSANNIVSNSESMKKETLYVYNDAKKELEKTLENLNSISQIKEMADIIVEMSHRTKILSINASIEASRAGESGKGFKVLANEIGNLAEISAQSSSDIQKLALHVDNILNELIVATHNILNVMNANMEKTYNILTELSTEYTETGSNINYILNNFKKETTEMANSLSDIFASVEALSEVMSSVSCSSDNIAQDINDVSIDMYEILHASNVNKENMERLSELISKFKTS